VPEPIETLWSHYKDSGAEDLRERLILHYSPLVKFVAGRVAAGLPRTVDPADCISFGMFGLIDAVAKFDPTRGIRFEPYAIGRIRGAILDELRALDWIPRSIRAKARALERAYAAVETRLGRTPTEPELAGELGIATSELHQLFGQVSTLNVLALDELLGAVDDTPGAPNLGDTLHDPGTPDPAAVFESLETRQLLADAVSALAQREQMLVRLYYFEGFTLAEIGKVLGVTESRVSQMHSKAVLALRTRLAAMS
jgi:RNA polymerase sigma factor for flagellar operon FliA